MDEAFEKRKAELLSECDLPRQLVEECADDLDAFLEPFLQGFSRERQREHAATLVRGLCSDVEGKKCETIAYHFG